MKNNGCYINNEIILPPVYQMNGWTAGDPSACKQIKINFLSFATGTLNNIHSFTPNSCNDPGKKVTPRSYAFTSAAGAVIN